MRITRSLLRIALAVVATLLLFSAGWIGWRHVPDQVLIPRLGRLSSHRIEQRLGYPLSYRAISSNLFTHLTLVEVRAALAHPSRQGRPSLPIVLVADHLHVRYSATSIWRKRIRHWELHRPRLLVGDRVFALEVTPQGDRVEARCLA